MFSKKILMFLCIVLSAQVGYDADAAAPINSLVLRGIECLYDWKFSEAEDLFRGVVAENPSDPMGYFYLAMVSWSRLASGFWTREVVEEYGRRIDRTISVAKRKIQRDQPDSFDYLYLGGALGYKGRFELMKKKYLSSFFLAVQAVDALKTSLEMNPDNKDVLFGLGLFDYYTAKFKGVLRFLTYLFVNRNTKEEGLRKLHEAAEDAVYSSTEAKSMLLHIYLFLEDNQYDRALPIAKELAARFRNNARFKFLEGVSYIRLDMDSRYRETVEYLNREAAARTPSQEEAKWQNRALYLQACYLLLRGRQEEARAKLHEILSNSDPLYDPAMMAWPLLKIGMAYDVEGSRKEALQYYTEVLRLANGAGAQFLAEKYMDEPVEKGDPFLAY
ncbi:MAG: hypothetical protein JRJ29_20405 [Deltaproteobacteria bacterium]|nr:hypothetical protein [Deltaproteobacteria bacterium]